MSRARRQRKATIRARLRDESAASRPVRPYLSARERRRIRMTNQRARFWGGLFLVGLALIITISEIALHLYATDRCEIRSESHGSLRCTDHWLCRNVCAQSQASEGWRTVLGQQHGACDSSHSQWSTQNRCGRCGRRRRSRESSDDSCSDDGDRDSCGNGCRHTEATQLRSISIAAHQRAGVSRWEEKRITGPS